MFNPTRNLLMGAALLAASTAPCFATCSTTAEALQCWQATIPLTSVTCSNLYQDLKVKVTLTDGVETRSTYAYWDGGNALTFRIAFPDRPGAWTWSSTCEPNELGVNNCGCATGHTLSNQPVSVGTAPMVLSSVIHPRVNDLPPNQGRYLKGTFDNALFWLGDTVWSGPHKSTRSQWASYLADRAGRELSALQVALPSSGTSMPLDAVDPGVAGDIARAPFEQIPGCVNPTPNDPLPNHCSRWIPQFWQEWTRRIEDANDAGLVVAVVGLMEGPIEKKGGTWCAPRLEYSKIYARNVAARLAGSSVILSPGFDRHSGSNQCPCYDTSQSGGGCTAGNPGPVATRIDAVGTHLATVVPHLLITNHTGSGMPPGEILSYQDKPWLDLQLFQSGQAGYVAGTAPADQLDEVLCKARDWPLCVWRRNCATFAPARSNKRLCPATITSPVASQIKPGINGESLYDGVSDDKFGSTNYTPYTVRRTAWLSLLGGAAGYTYGNLELYDWSNYTAGLARTSNQHMQYIANLFIHHLSWWELAPQPEKIANNAGTTELTRMALAHNAANTELVAYLPNNAEIQIDYATLGSLPKAGQWYDPRTGLFLHAGYGQGNQVGASSVWKFCRPCGTVTCIPPAGTPARPACPASGTPGSTGADYVLVIH